MPSSTRGQGSLTWISNQHGGDREREGEDQKEEGDGRHQHNDGYRRPGDVGHQPIDPLVISADVGTRLGQPSLDSPARIRLMTSGAKLRGCAARASLKEEPALTRSNRSLWMAERSVMSLLQAEAQRVHQGNATTQLQTDLEENSMSTRRGAA